MGPNQISAGLAFSFPPSLPPSLSSFLPSFLPSFLNFIEYFLWHCFLLGYSENQNSNNLSSDGVQFLGKSDKLKCTVGAGDVMDRAGSCEDNR